MWKPTTGVLHITYSMEQHSSWEANWFSGSQEIPCILWNPKVHHRTHKWFKLYTHIFSFGVLWKFMLMFLKIQMCKVSKGFSIYFLFTDWFTLWSKYFLCTNDLVSIYWQLDIGILFETVTSWNVCHLPLF